MGLLAFVIRCLAAPLSLFPVRERVAFLSRQSSAPSLDYRMLRDELARRLGAGGVAVCLAAPETQGRLAFARNMLVQLWYARTSRVCIVDGYSPVVSIPPKRPGCTVIQLWHALGAVKRFGLQAVGTPAGRSEHEARVGRMHRNYDIVAAAGPGAVEAYAQAFGYGPSTVRATGLPRMDYLMDPSPNAPRRLAAARLAAEHPFLGEAGPKLLYAPTFRRKAADAGWLTRAIEDLARAFEKTRFTLVVAGHPLQSGFDRALLERHPHLRFVPGAATIDLLGTADCVITDYSAVAFEAALAGVGVYFYVPDIVEYRRSPGLNIDPALEFADVAATTAADLAAKLEADAGLGAGSSFSRYAEAYFEGVAFGSTARLADLVCGRLA